MHHADHPTRRSLFRNLAAAVAAGGLTRLQPLMAAAVIEDGPPRVLPVGSTHDDRRLGPLKDLDGYFPFEPPSTAAEWAARAEAVRRQILVAAGLWPMPTRAELVPVIHGAVERPGYTVEKVYFESFPGLYVTGNLYRPAEAAGPIPAILCPHGHWTDGRFHRYGDEQLRGELESGAERFEVGGRYPLQARCVQLARMGCAVFHYDMIGYADSVPITYEVSHRFAEQRPELSGPDRWGLFSAQAELRLQNVLGLQLFNSIRALDFVLGLPGVDPSRLAVTGSSGGGTQTMLLAAVDDRLAAAFPAVMVSTAMQGGCTCENASYLRIGTGNVEFAALMAPKPLGVTGANDWTVEIESKGLPELRRLYDLLGAPGNVTGRYFDFGHNYNAVSRAFMYDFMNEHLKLGLSEPIEEADYQPLDRDELTVWDAGHPKPPTDEDAEVRLLKALDADSNAQMQALTPSDRTSLEQFREVVGGAVEVMVGRTLPEAGAITYDKKEEVDRGDYLETTALLRHEEAGEAVPTVFLYPKEWRGRVAIWIDGRGKAALYGEDGAPTAAVRRLMDAGVAVAGCDLLGIGEAVGAEGPLERSRSVENPREFLGYTVGYNPPLFAQRVRDVLTVLGFIRHHDYSPARVDLVATGGAGPWAIGAAAVAREAVDALAVDTGGFRFGRITEIRDPDLWPGAVKYGDLPGLLALCAPVPLWLAGEGESLPGPAADAYAAAGASGKAHLAADGGSMAAAEWLVGG